LIRWENLLENKNMTAQPESKKLIGKEFVITREFEAPRELVFKAWTDPWHLAQWWGPRGFTNPVCEWDARPGKAIHVVMRAPNGVDYPMGGEFREVTAPERLVFTSGALDKKGKLLFEFLHDVAFTERKGKTKLTIRSRIIKTTAEAGKYIGGFEAGMTQSLERLVGLLPRLGKPLVIERTFDAPVAKVWKVLTDKKEIKQWSFEVKEFKAEVGFEFQLYAEKDGVKYIHHCKITGVIPRKKLAYSWRYEGYEGDSLVTFELWAEGGRTRLKLTHEGLDSFPKIPDFARENFMAGWTHITGALQKFVEPDTASREIVISRDFDAPRELAWRAMTDPRQVVHWWGPRGFTTTIEKMDVKPGGIWKHVMRGPDGVEYPNKSVFKEVVEPERIVFAHGGAKKGGPEATFVATWTFEALKAGKTRVTIRMVFPTAAARDKVVKEYGAIEGGKQCLERLGEHLAKMGKG
jgi:uncharacterized protein YndB with AHSA1/START domain